MPEVVTHGWRIRETGSLVKPNLLLTLLDTPGQRCPPLPS